MVDDGDYPRQRKETPLGVNYFLTSGSKQNFSLRAWSGQRRNLFIHGKRNQLIEGEEGGAALWMGKLMLD